ncbi:hypothetical protein GDO81_018468 [Engystomops pustulosus]|uniref:Uncharacterized protein n=1 Tax=Engystomops pustulosus TaxID=76066 RepID=A0AAV6ZUU1_ENGPU|nr:hypothetical protein GDO81_018468 [Engystomops pustulosus]
MKDLRKQGNVSEILLYPSDGQKPLEPGTKGNNLSRRDGSTPPNILHITSMFRLYYCITRCVPILRWRLMDTRDKIIHFSCFQPQVQCHLRHNV